MKPLKFNKQVTNYNAIARFYLTPIGEFYPYKYVSQKRLDEILEECYIYGGTTTKKLIDEFYGKN